ncbi:MAG: endolytic transglycosylase MltG [Magnetospirillum sp.]|nr:endolytic transglycosylase MltG [Magnetospirillum sp.]
MSRRLGASLAIAALLVVVCAALTAWALSERYVRPGPSIADIQLVIPRGAGAEEIARLLVERGVLASSFSFLAGSRWDGTLPRFKAGEYLFAAGISARAAGELLASGRTVQRRITFAEGLMSAQIVELLRAAEGFEGALDAVPPEGSLLPETYFYSWGESRARAIERAQRAMRESLAELWAKRAPDLPLATPEEALVLASIVERETAHADERGRVAAVFVNRLRRKMRLQADPTVAYGLSPGVPLGRPLSRADLETRHAWNTYAIDGLPPTPIANPGRAAIAAVLNPPADEALYFVADGEGRHVFARTLPEHNRNVARLREIERARAAGQR